MINKNRKKIFRLPGIVDLSQKLDFVVFELSHLFALENTHTIEESKLQQTQLEAIVSSFHVCRGIQQVYLVWSLNLPKCRTSWILDLGS